MSKACGLGASRLGNHHSKERHDGHRWQDGPPKEGFDFDAYAYFTVTLPDGRHVFTHVAYFFENSLSYVLEGMGLFLAEMSKKEEYNKTLEEVAGHDDPYIRDSEGGGSCLEGS